ncbi:MAG: DUF4129 domain-containing protein [Gemmatimonadaceae bacterium]|nr:DUF4129 domain-containing protein [Gemmatimonadaceae bacterium]
MTGLVQSREVAADSLRALIEVVLRAPEYQARAPRDAWAPVARAWWALLDWVDRLRESNPLGYRAFVWLMVLILAAIVLHAMWIAARTLRAGTAPAPAEPLAQSSIVRDAAWYAREVERLTASGRLAEAMQADFLRFVLELDARRVARFHPSKTPSEYVREADLGDEARRDLRAVVATLYAHVYARVAITPEAWARWRDLASADRYAASH